MGQVSAKTVRRQISQEEAVERGNNIWEIGLQNIASLRLFYLYEGMEARKLLLVCNSHKKKKAMKLLNSSTFISSSIPFLPFSISHPHQESGEVSVNWK